MMKNDFISLAVRHDNDVDVKCEEEMVLLLSLTLSKAKSTLKSPSHFDWKF